jgi:hypothetical protein
MNIQMLTGKRAKDHYTWRKRVNDALPDLAHRVFSLRSGGYYGVGMHPSLERKLGRALTMANEFEMELAQHIPTTDQLIYEDLVDTLRRAEWSKAHFGSNPEALGMPWSPEMQQQLEESFSRFRMLAESVALMENAVIIDLQERLLSVDDETRLELVADARSGFVANVVGMAFDFKPGVDPVLSELVVDLYESLDEQSFPEKELALILYAYGLEDAVAKVDERLAGNAMRI